MPGLTSMPDAPTVARMVVAATGESPGDLRIVGQGVTAVAWRAETDHGSYCVLVALPIETYAERYPDARPQFEARSAVQAALRARDPRCPEPLATNLTPGVPGGLAGIAWMVSSWETGSFLDGPMPDAVARDLGEVVAQLHKVPSSGYGMLADTGDAIRGTVSDPGEAFTSRWGAETWPFNGLPLSTHPIVRAAPRLVMPAAALREQLLAYAEVPARAVCHTDLNRSNYLVEDGRLTALIDFGDAAIEPPALDIASFAFNEGWETTEHFLEGYASNSVLRDIRRAEAQQLAVVLALQKIHKYAKQRPDAERLQRAIVFLEATLPRASRRSDA